MSRSVPLVTAAAGCGGTGRELGRFGDLAALDAILIGPVGLPGGAARRASVTPTSSGVVFRPAPVLPVDRVVEEILPWCAARGLSVVCAVRGSTVGLVTDTITRLSRALDFPAVVGVEIDLTTPREHTRPVIGGLAATEPEEPWSADPQACLKLLSAARERLPRDLLLQAKIGGECPDLVATARAAVGGGARALVLDGAVPALGADQRLAGPAIAPVTLGLLRTVRTAIAAGRVPEVPLVAVGGIRDVASAQRALGDGAVGVQLGCGILTDPHLLWEVQTILTHPGNDPSVEPPAQEGTDPAAAERRAR